MTFKLKKEILLILSLSFISIAINAQHKQCISDQECGQGQRCEKALKLMKVYMGYIDENIGRCTVPDRFPEPVSNEESQRLQNAEIQRRQHLTPPSTSTAITSQRLPAAPTTGQSQLLTQTPVATQR